MKASPLQSNEPSFRGKQKQQHSGETPAIPDKVWKRVTDPLGLPEQNIDIPIKKRRTLKEEILHNKNLMHKMSMRQFDDRLFIIDKEDTPTKNLLQVSSEEQLKQEIGFVGFNKLTVEALVAEYGGPALEMLKVGLSVWRSVFNLFTWRDPFLTSLFFFGLIFLLCVLLLFPWRLFFFVMGLGAVGPQVSA